MKGGNEERDARWHGMVCDVISGGWINTVSLCASLMAT